MTTQSNPFSPPLANVEMANATPLLTPAGKGRRFGTFVVDYLCYLAMAFAIGITIGIVFGEAGAQALQGVPDVLFGIALFSAYYLFFEGIFGRTPGKFAFGTIVVDERGGKPSFGRLVGRTLARFIPFEPFSAFGERPWHDKLSKTRVVMAR